jgi:hypothetical protein
VKLDAVVTGSAVAHGHRSASSVHKSLNLVTACCPFDEATASSQSMADEARRLTELMAGYECARDSVAAPDCPQARTRVAISS